LDLFLRRTKVFTANIFTIVNVDKLPGKCLEKVLSFMSERENTTSQLHCVQENLSMLHASNFVEGSEWGAFATAAESPCWKRYILNAESFDKVDVVVGASGAGKTRLIRKELQEIHRNKEIGAITFHEGSTMDSLTDDVVTAFTMDGLPKALHVSFMCTPEPDSEANGKWFETVNRFFFSLLALRVVRNNDSSKSFHMGQGSWALYVELPLTPRLNGCAVMDSAREWLRRHIPLLALCCELRRPDPLISINDDARRVCTYLRAYENGTINRKFFRGRKVVFVLDRSGSMALDFGIDQTAFEAAVDCAMEIFDSHVHANDVSFVAIILSGLCIEIIQLCHSALPLDGWGCTFQ
jgi:hypothetical protein